MDGRMEPLPPQVELVMLAKWMGVPVWELDSVPLHWINWSRVVRGAMNEAEAKSQGSHKP